MQNPDQSRDTFTKPVAVGVGSIVVRDNRMLLVRRRNVHGDGQWSTPGGYLAFGESPEQCAVRELKEETGVYAGPFRFVAITNDLFASASRHFVTIWMVGPWLAGEPTPCAR